MLTKWRRSVGVLFALVGTTCPVLAEPGPSVSFLIDQPVSLMSFGLARLSDFLVQRYGPGSSHLLASPLSGPATYSPQVVYNWDENSIILLFWPFGERQQGWDYEEECKQLFSFIRYEAGVDPQTGRVQKGLPRSLIAMYFQQVGYSSKGIDEAATKIDGIVNFVFYGGTSGFVCTGSLLDTGYAVQH